MRLLAIGMFGLNTLAELAAGAIMFVRGGASVYSAEQIAEQTFEMAVVARFHASALIALGLMSLLVLVTQGVRSKVAKFVAGGFAMFHLLGCAGIVVSAWGALGALAQPYPLTPFVLHGVLGIGFVVVYLTVKRPPKDAAAA